MSTRRYATIAIVIATAAGGYLALSQRPRESGQGSLRPSSAQPPDPASRPDARGTRPAADRAAPGARAQAPSTPGSQGPITLHAGDVVAQVNGVPVRASDLAPIGDPSRALTMSRERYDFLRDRAIERELVLQAARAEGVTLTDDQKQEMVTAVEDVEGQIGVRNAASFERRELRSRLLLNELAVRAGVESPFATQAEVDAYLQQHAAELGAPPEDAEARAAMEARIREKLALDKQQAHGDALRELIDELKQKANIT